MICTPVISPARSRTAMNELSVVTIRPSLRCHDIMTVVEGMSRLARIRSRKSIKVDRDSGVTILPVRSGVRTHSSGVNP